MKLQFETLDYQQQAIQSVLNLFIGQPNSKADHFQLAQHLPIFAPTQNWQRILPLAENLAKQQNSQKN